MQIVYFNNRYSWALRYKRRREDQEDIYIGMSERQNTDFHKGRRLSSDAKRGMRNYLDIK